MGVLLHLVLSQFICIAIHAATLTTTEKQAILDLHNELRDRVAGGGLSAEGHPAATDMNYLVWDEGLEAVAQTYAESCPGLVHNPNKNFQIKDQRDSNPQNTKWGTRNGPTVSSYIYIGENLAANSEDYTLTLMLSQIETEWWDQYKVWTFGPSSDGCLGDCGRYTQMAWANTRYIGCGYANGCSSGGWESVFVCNYFPVGNMNGATTSPYTEATVATKCSSCMSDRTECKSIYTSRSNTASNYPNQPYNALCGGGMCATMCDGASYSTSNCDGTGCTPLEANTDCTDGTISLNSGRDICSWSHAPSSPTNTQTSNPTSAPTSPCVELSGIMLSMHASFFNGQWSESGILNSEPYYMMDSYYLYWSSAYTRWMVGDELGGSSTYRYCMNTDIMTCTEGTWDYWDGSGSGEWLSDAEATVSVCTIPTNAPSSEVPSNGPTISPSRNPAPDPSLTPTLSPTLNPSSSPTDDPTLSPTKNPANDPTLSPLKDPSVSPTNKPTIAPTHDPSLAPTKNPSLSPTNDPILTPTRNPTVSPTKNPTLFPTNNPSLSHTNNPTLSPTNNPSQPPTKTPTSKPTQTPTLYPTLSPTHDPSLTPTNNPTSAPTDNPALSSTDCLELSGHTSFFEFGALNGQWSNTGTLNDKPYYMMDSYYLYWSSTYWVVGPTLGGAAAYSYCVNTDLMTCTEGTWDYWDGAASAFTLDAVATVSACVVQTNSSSSPTQLPTAAPIKLPTEVPTNGPTISPSRNPASDPTLSPTNNPSLSPTIFPTDVPTSSPTEDTPNPTNNPTLLIPTTSSPSVTPSSSPSNDPTSDPSQQTPTLYPTLTPTDNPALSSTDNPTFAPTDYPASTPTNNTISSVPTNDPLTTPTVKPTIEPTVSPTNCEQNEHLDNEDCTDDGCEYGAFLDFTLSFSVCRKQPFVGNRYGLWNGVIDCVCALGFKGTDYDYSNGAHLRRRLKRGNNNCDMTVVKYSMETLIEPISSVCNTNGYRFAFGIQGCGDCVYLTQSLYTIQGMTEDEIYDAITTCAKWVAIQIDKIGFEEVEDVVLEGTINDDDDQCDLTANVDMKGYNVFVMMSMVVIAYIIWN